MSDKVQIEVKLFNPGIPTADGIIYNEETFAKAVEEYHRLEDVCGEIKHLDKTENNEFTANISLSPSTYKGKMVCELLNDENIDTSHMYITPDGFYDSENDKMTITSYSLDYQPNDNKGKNN